MKLQTGLDVDEDIDGNALQPPIATSDVGQLVYLLEYARKRGFAFSGRIKIGGVEVTAHDLRVEVGGDATPDVGAWEAAGYKEGE